MKINISFLYIDDLRFIYYNARKIIQQESLKILWVGRGITLIGDFLKRMPNSEGDMKAYLFLYKSKGIPQRRRSTCRAPLGKHEYDWLLALSEGWGWLVTESRASVIFCKCGHPLTVRR